VILFATGKKASGQMGSTKQHVLMEGAEVNGANYKRSFCILNLKLS
jgi:hypothetical protein